MLRLERTHACAPSTTRGRALLLSSNGADTLAFANGRSVVLLNVNTQHAELFNEHTAQCTAARFAPTGNCILSGDASGCVRVWARGGTTQLQVQALAGEVNDLQLTGDTIKTLFVAGAGRGRLLAAFNADTGAALGNLTGVARPANTLDVSDDGLRVVCGDDGGALSVHDASVPFKNRFSLQDQSGGRAVNCVRFAPGGCTTFSVVGGKNALLYTGDGVAPTELVGHAGSVYCSAWRNDAAQLITAGMDKTVRLWDARTAREVAKFSAGSELDDVQLGCAWLGLDVLASVSLGGDVRLFDHRMASCFRRIVAHQRSITALAVGNVKSSEEELFSTDYLGRTLRWKPGECCVGRMPTAHSNSVVGAAVSGTQLVMCGLDDHVSWTAGDTTRATPLPCAPKAMGMSANGLAVIATVKGVVTARDGAILSSLELGSATAAAVTGDGCVAAVGCEDGRIHMFAVAATGELQPHAILVKHRGAVTALAFSNSDRMLASGDANREVLIWEECEKTWAVKVSGMVYHTARVTCLSWAPDGQRLASGGVDCNIIIWNLAEPASKRVTMAGAHRDGVSALCWLSSGSLLSAGADACVRVWV